MSETFKQSVAELAGHAHSQLVLGYFRAHPERAAPHEQRLGARKGDPRARAAALAKQLATTPEAAALLRYITHAETRSFAEAIAARPEARHEAAAAWARAHQAAANAWVGRGG